MEVSVLGASAGLKVQNIMEKLKSVIIKMNDQMY